MKIHKNKINTKRTFDHNIGKITNFPIFLILPILILINTYKLRVYRLYKQEI